VSYCPDCGWLYTSWSHGCRPHYEGCGVQQSLDLRAAGYREPSPESQTYPYLSTEGL
jgi:hypothetical protein